MPNEANSTVGDGERVLSPPPEVEAYRLSEIFTNYCNDVQEHQNPTGYPVNPDPYFQNFHNQRNKYSEKSDYRDFQYRLPIP